MKRTSNQTNLIISLLCLSIVTACGGGSGGGFLGENSQDNHFGGGAKPLDPINDIRAPVDIFLVNMASEGKQLKNIAVSVDDDRNGRITYGDAVRFNQPGAVSCFLGGNAESSSSGQSSGSSCGSFHLEGILKPLEQGVESAKAKQKKAEETLNKAETELQEARNAQNPPPPSRIAELEREVATAKVEVAKAEAEVKKAEAGLDAMKDRTKGVSMLDVNNVLHIINRTSTIDHNDERYSQFLSHDVGVRKIDAERKINNGKAELYNYGGSINRAYNGIILFASGENLRNNNNAYVDIYLRSPAAAGWSYNTFGAFSSKFLRNARDVNIGYQSIGKQVEDLPASGVAKYLGIAHAYINDIEASRYSQKENSQVTMDVEINADFAKRSLGFDTRNTYIHTYEGVNDQHIIQARPDLNLHGSASWNRGVGDFRGSVHNAGGNLSGAIEGSFYGPKAAEVGGVFGLSGDDKEAPGSKTHRTHYVGGFGAKRD